MFCSSYSNFIVSIIFHDVCYAVTYKTYFLASRSNSITSPYLYTHFQTAMLWRVLPSTRVSLSEDTSGRWNVFSPVLPAPNAGVRSKRRVNHPPLSLLGTINDFGYWRVSYTMSDAVSNPAVNNKVSGLDGRAYKTQNTERNRRDLWFLSYFETACGVNRH